MPVGPARVHMKRYVGSAPHPHRRRLRRRGNHGEGQQARGLCGTALDMCAEVPRAAGLDWRRANADTLGAREAPATSDSRRASKGNAEGLGFVRRAAIARATATHSTSPATLSNSLGRFGGRRAIHRIPATQVACPHVVAVPGREIAERCAGMPRQSQLSADPGARGTRRKLAAKCGDACEDDGGEPGPSWVRGSLEAGNLVPRRQRLRWRPAQLRRHSSTGSTGRVDWPRIVAQRLAGYVPGEEELEERIWRYPGCDRAKRLAKGTPARDACIPKNMSAEIDAVTFQVPTPERRLCAEGLMRGGTIDAHVSVAQLVAQQASESGKRGGSSRRSFRALFGARLYLVIGKVLKRRVCATEAEALMHPSFGRVLVSYSRAEERPPSAGKASMVPPRGVRCCGMCARRGLGRTP